MKIILIATLLFSVSAFSAEKKAAVSEPSYPEAGDVRCEKLNGHNLSEFKTKLVESCDLSKPFSSSLSRILNEDTYFYCCQIRK